MRIVFKKIVETLSNHCYLKGSLTVFTLFFEPYCTWKIGMYLGKKGGTNN